MTATVDASPQAVATRRLRRRRHFNHVGDTGGAERAGHHRGWMTSRPERTGRRAERHHDRSIQRWGNRSSTAAEVLPSPTDTMPSRGPGSERRGPTSAVSFMGLWAPSKIISTAGSRRGSPARTDRAVSRTPDRRRRVEFSEYGGSGRLGVVTPVVRRRHLDQTHPMLGGCRPRHIDCFARRLRAEHGGRASGEHRRLLGCDRRHRRAQDVGVVEADRRHGGDDIGAEDIGGVDPATDARFDDEPVGAGPSRHHQGDCGGQGKKVGGSRWKRARRRGVGFLDGGDDLLPRRQFIGHHEALTDVVHVGRLVESDRPTRRSERGSDKAGNGALCRRYRRHAPPEPGPVGRPTGPATAPTRAGPARLEGAGCTKRGAIARPSRIGRHHRRTTLSAPCALRYPWIPSYGTVPPYRTVLDGDS